MDCVGIICYENELVIIVYEFINYLDGIFFD